MSFDRETKRIFTEELHESLRELEDALLQLERQPDSGELVGQVFRVLHTLKGAAGMFGLSGAVDFIHQIENYYSKIRDSKAAAGAAEIQGSLGAIGLIETLCQLQEDESEPQLSPREAEDLDQLLMVFGRGTGSDGSEPTGASDQESGPLRRYDIHWAPSADSLLKGVDPALVIADLRHLGDLELHGHWKEGASFQDSDPEQLLLSFSGQLLTRAPKVQVEHQFIFFDPGEYDVREIPSTGVQREVGRDVGNHDQVDHPRTHNKDASIRVRTAKLDQLVLLSGELVTAHAQLSHLAMAHNDRSLAARVEYVDSLVRDLRALSSELSMVAVRSLFRRFVRPVRDLALELGKNVELVTEGDETELDKTLMDGLYEPLLHIVRNAIDHGIEAPNQRRAWAKPEKAQLQLRALTNGPRVLVEVIDDGQGIDRGAVAAKARGLGLWDRESDPNDEELLDVLSAPGFSTSTEVSDISGRGVGMDVVRRQVQALGGDVHLSTMAGEGSRFSLSLPLRMAVLEGLLVRVGDTHYVINVAAIEECRDPSTSELSRGRIMVRDRVLPLIDLREVLGAAQPWGERPQVVVVNGQEGTAALVVDRVDRLRQSAIKPLSAAYAKVRFLGGSSILGDGTVAFLLDVEYILKRSVIT